MFRSSRSKKNTKSSKQSSLKTPLFEDSGLSTAIQEGYADHIEKLASENFNKFFTMMKTKGEQLHKTPLQIAAEQGDLYVLNAIIKAGMEKSLKQALSDLKREIRQQENTAKNDKQLTDLYAKEEDLDYRIMHIGLFANPYADNPLYSKKEALLRDRYHHLKQKGTLNQTQSQFLEFFENYAPKDLKTERPEASAAASHYNLNNSY